MVGGHNVGTVKNQGAPDPWQALRELANLVSALLGIVGLTADLARMQCLKKI